MVETAPLELGLRGGGRYTTCRRAAALQHGRVVEQPCRFVYVIQSLAKPERHYVGLTADVASRLRDHNAGQSPQTAKHRPWKLVVYAGFASAALAERVVKDLKSASARGMVSRYFT